MVQVELTKAVEERLAARAARHGEDLSRYIARLAERDAARPTLEEISGDTYRAFLESGMTDDELGDMLEKAKHEMRAEKDRAEKARALGVAS